MTFDKAELIERFPHYKEQIEGYTKPDTHITFNQDEDLQPINIEVDFVIRKNATHISPNNPPTSIMDPDWSKVMNFGLPAKDQYFRAPVKPDQLQSLEKQFNKPSKAKGSKEQPLDGEEFWNELESDPVKYRESIQYIKKMRYFYKYGYWCFINGKPTYIDGWHLIKLTEYRQGNYETIDRKTNRVIRVDTPEYRDLDRRRFIFYRWCAVDTTDHTGKDFGRRTCYGWIYPKHRRAGATTDAMVIAHDTVTTISDSYSSMIGNTDKTASETFTKKFMTAYLRYPVWMRPKRDGRVRPQRELRFISQKPGVRSDANLLESWIDYADKASRSYYDHSEITGFILLDEEGKTTLTDILEGWSVVKPTMAPGGGISIKQFALAAHPSTVEEIEGGGGDKYFKLCKQSDYYNSSKLSGQTDSGLRIFYVPAWDGLEGFIGPYGESVIDTPSASQARFIGKKFGAKEFLLGTIEKLEKTDTYAAKQDLASFKRKYPINWDSIWDIKGQDTGFNKEKLTARQKEIVLNGIGKHVVEGNLYWKIDDQLFSAREYIHAFGTGVNIDLDSRAEVVFKAEPDGRFHMSNLKGRISLSGNKKMVTRSDIAKHQQMFVPTEPDIFIASADPMQQFSESEYKQGDGGTKMSLGAGVVFMLRDPSIDGSDKPLEQWVTHTFVCDYLFRPSSSEEYAEEMLMMCVFWGCLMYPEVNKTTVWDHFVNRGYNGFLKYDLDRVSGMPVKKPGFYTTSGNSDTKDSLFRGMRSYIEYHIGRENHIRIIRQCSKLKGFEDMTHKDLFAAAAGALKGITSDYDELIKGRHSTIDIGKFIESF